MTQLLLLIGVAVLVALNGLFVAAEFALVRASQGRVEQLRDDGRRGAALVLKQIERIDEYLSACQLGITMTSLGIGFLGEPAIAQLFEDGFGTTISHSASLAISLTLELFRRVFNPLIWLLNSASNGVLRLIGVDPRAEFEDVSSSEDLKMIIARSAHGGKLDPGEAGMLSGVFHLHEQQARQVMTPIPAVGTVDVSEDAETALRRWVDSGHTRLVVTEEGNTDRIKGIVHANSLARRLMTDGPSASIEDSVKDAPIVPETKPLDDLLADLQRERSSMAVVIDEYGRVAGVVTVEDIVEEVVGEIADETDPAGGEVRRLANGDWFVRGHVAVTDLLDYGLELPVDTDAYNSVGGFVFAELGRLPKRGDTITANGYSIRVESVRENRIEAVRIRERRAVSQQTRPAE